MILWPWRLWKRIPAFINFYYFLSIWFYWLIFNISRRKTTPLSFHRTWLESKYFHLLIWKFVRNSSHCNSIECRITSKWDENEIVKIYKAKYVCTPWKLFPTKLANAQTIIVVYINNDWVSLVMRTFKRMTEVCTLW